VVEIQFADDLKTGRIVHPEVGGRGYVRVKKGNAEEKRNKPIAQTREKRIDDYKRESVYGERVKLEVLTAPNTDTGRA